MICDIQNRRANLSEDRDLENIFDHLYLDSKKRIFKKRQSENEFYGSFNFQPIINPSSITSSFTERQDKLREKSLDLKSERIGNNQQISLRGSSSRVFYV